MDYNLVLHKLSLLDGDVDGVGGAAGAIAEEGVKVEAAGGPVGRERQSYNLVGTHDGRCEEARFQHGTVGEEMEGVVGMGVAKREAGTKGDAQRVVVIHMHPVDKNRGHGTTTYHYARIVDKTVGCEAVFVQTTKVGIGAELHALGMPMEPEKMGFGHVRGEPHDVDECIAMRLLPRCLGVTNLLGLVAHHLFRGNGVNGIYPVPYCASYFVSLYCCHCD